MTEAKKREIMTFVNGWYQQLSSAYKTSWKEFEKYRNIVVKQMGLSEDYAYILTKREMASYVAYSYKRDLGFTGNTTIDERNILYKKGTTAKLKVISDMNKLYTEYGNACGNIAKTFDAKINALRKNKR